MTPDVHALAGAYAVDALPDDERAFFERHLARCEACQREVSELRATAAILGSAAAEAPPPTMRDRVLAQIETTRQERPPTPDAQVLAWHHRLRPALAVAAVVALFAIVGLGILSAQLAGRVADLEAEVARSDDLVALLAEPDVVVRELDGPEGTAATLVASTGRDRGFFVAEGLDALPQGQAYQLWTIEGDVPLPDEVFRPDAQGRVVVALGGSIRTADLVAVTVEPATGSVEPTGDVLISGPAGG